MRVAAQLTSRRTLLLGAAAGLAIRPGAAAPAALRATPAQTAGPFYPDRLPADRDSDLVQVRGVAARAEGIVTHLSGRVLGRDGRPISGATVEIWQCDARGLYRHSADRPGQRDGAFQGFGRTLTGADGHYAFRTIRPVAYPGRTPHIHVLVRAPGRLLVTQVYVAGEPLNAADGLYASLGRAAREAVTVALAEANGIETGALAGSFDIVL